MGGVYEIEGTQEIIADMYRRQDSDYVGLSKDRRLKDEKKSLYKYISSKEEIGGEGNITDEGRSV